MKLRQVARRALLPALALAVGCGGEAEPTAPRPNILLILADDMGYGDLRTYNPESKIAMPNLEQLAREGMRFTDAHSPSSICAPTRYSLITGNYPWRGRDAAGVWEAFGAPQILPDQTTVAELLKDHGYRTAKFGKDHLGGLFQRKDGSGVARTAEEIDYGRRFSGGPTDEGFDSSFTVPCGIQDPPFAYFRDDKLESDVAALRHWQQGVYGDSEIMRPGVGAADWDSSQVGPRMVDEAIAFLGRQAARNASEGAAPFFLYYSAIEMHWPWTPAASLRGHPVRGVTGLDARSDLVHQFDLAIGELLAELERLGLADDTVVIVTSDNGGEVYEETLALGHSTVGRLAGGKGSLAEGGHRVPFVVRWGDGTAAGSRVPPGGVSGQLIGLQDLFATVADLVGAEVPAGQARDSFSFLPVLFGERDEASPIRDHLIVQDSRVVHFGFREGPWKLALKLPRPRQDGPVGREGSSSELFHVDPTGIERSAREVLSPEEYEQRRGLMSERFRELRYSERTAPAVGASQPR